MYGPEEIEVTFAGDKISIKVATVKPNLNLVIPAKAGILMRSSGMLDIDGVEGFEGDVVAFQKFKKNDPKKKNGSAFRGLVWDTKFCRWTLRTLAKGKVVGNIYQPKKPVNTGLDI